MKEREKDREILSTRPCVYVCVKTERERLCVGERERKREREREKERKKKNVCEKL
jgi:hypothetical protein